MTNRLGILSWATGALVLAALTACGHTEADPPSPGASTSAPSAASSGPTTRSPSDAAVTASTETIERYFSMMDEVARDPASSLTQLDRVATSTQLNAAKAVLRSQHQQGQRQAGTSRIAEQAVQSVNVDNSAPKAGRIPTVVVDVCWDVGDVDVLNQAGESIVSSDRPDSGWTRFTVANYRYDAHPASGWRVVNGRDLERAPCAV